MIFNNRHTVINKEAGWVQPRPAYLKKFEKNEKANNNIDFFSDS